MKRTRIEQNNIPSYSLVDAVRIAHALYENFAGKPTAPTQIAIALDLSPTSSTWRYLSVTASACGLTNGAYNSKEISLTDIGRKIVAPTIEGVERLALIQATLTPLLLNKFFNNYKMQSYQKTTLGA